jgi:hypothetical protein
VYPQIMLDCSSTSLCHPASIYLHVAVAGQCALAVAFPLYARNVSRKVPIILFTLAILFPVLLGIVYSVALFNIGSQYGTRPRRCNLSRILRPDRYQRSVACVVEPAANNRYTICLYRQMRLRMRLHSKSTAHGNTQFRRVAGLNLCDLWHKHSL